MKKIMLALLLPLAPMASFAQTLHDFYSNTAITGTFLGCDFTKAKIINDLYPPAEWVSNVIPSLHDLMTKEFKKYDVKAAFRRSALDNDFTAVEKHNQGMKPESLPATSATPLKAEDVKAVVRSLHYGGKSGIGILFVVESIDKPAKQIFVWVTLMCDMKSGQCPVHRKRVEGKVGSGIGERNIWANGIKSIIEEVDKHKYNEWKKSN